MLEFFKSWNPGAVTALVAVASFFLTIIIAVLSANWRRVRETEITADLKRELIQKGYSVEQVAQLVAVPLVAAYETGNEKELEGQLALLLVQHVPTGKTLEEILRIYQATDAATKKAVYDSVQEMLEAGGTEEQVLAVMRVLCPPKSAPSEFVCSRASL
jgi:hypothetical protein